MPVLAIHVHYRNSTLSFGLQTTLFPSQGLYIPILTKDHVGPYLIFLCSKLSAHSNGQRFSENKKKPLINFCCF